METALNNKTVIIIAGPTAVGKTAVAVEIAKHFNTEIISADSRQCFKELNVGVARPSVEELQLVKHHFIASHSIQEEINAVTFEQFALQKASEIFQHKDFIIMTGGTGLYIKAFCEGLDDIPIVPPGIRNKIIEYYNKKGLPGLLDEIEKKDPLFFKEGEIKNPQRVMRALEVIEATGCSIMKFREGKKKQRLFNNIKIGLELPVAELKCRIDERVDNMMQSGLVEEVMNLLPFKQLNALQTVGYAEIINSLESKTELHKAVEDIKIHTRQYAKRQMTWFKKDKEIKWFSPVDIGLIVAHVHARQNSFNKSTAM